MVGRKASVCRFELVEAFLRQTWLVHQIMDNIDDRRKFAQGLPTVVHAIEVGLSLHILPDLASRHVVDCGDSSGGQ